MLKTFSAARPLVSTFRPAISTQNRRIITVAGSLMMPDGRSSALARASDMHFNCDNSQQVARLEAAMESLPGDRAIVLAWTSLNFSDSKNRLVVPVHAGLTKAFKQGLKYKGKELSVEAIHAMKLQAETKRYLISALQGEATPAATSEQHCIEALDQAQKIFAGTTGFFDSRQDAQRNYPDSKERSHPKNLKGVYLWNDPGAQALIDARLPVNCGTSGTASNVMNAYYNIIGERMPDEMVATMGGAVHAYLAGEMMISVVGRDIEQGVRSAVGEDVFAQLKQTGLGQTHTLGEVHLACMLTHAAQKEGGPLSPEASAAVTGAAIERTRAAMENV
ncbi:hypothetical protein [Massilia antarctica]|nr:hypothetical protein [Massilia sp. H27-R4]MCY0914634.1 hypothetical protein [Massilia sp. H27-R4]CUI08340.1 hypothetical protein BN2497_11457 [Janthinobacterium sp. CG23_2]CUU32126.1 hypothetical protein BN3177_11457 [Janthinobacterium sp. CG23_2]